MGDRLYVDVSCVRIQAYLGRTTQLRGRRGASAAIAAATRFDPTGPCPFPGASFHEDAGEADGVVNLVVDSPGDTPDATARALAGHVFRRMRALLPAAQFQAVWGMGASYLDAHHRGIGPRLRRGDVVADLPAVPELPYAKVCEQCHLGPAERQIHLGGDESPFVCPDCVMRFDPGTRREARTAERELAETLAITGAATDMAALARLGATDGNRNQVATVFVDGNAFGDFFEHLATGGQRLDAATKGAISKALNAHTRTALAEAVFAVSSDADGGVLCAVPHLVGGDDVLVGLPADRAWMFIRQYLAEFDVRVAETRTLAAAHVADLPHLSASAGLVFAHASHPFHLVVEEAARQLAAAKSLVRGREASVAFADLTTGDHGPPVRLADLDAYADRLTALAGLPPAARQNLAVALRRAPDDTTALRNHAARLGRTAVLDPFLAEGSPIDLAHALTTTRWWT